MSEVVQRVVDDVVLFASRWLFARQVYFNHQLQEACRSGLGPMPMSAVASAKH